jgi:hypothetical protein
MTRSKNIVKELRPNTSNVTFSYSDKSSSKVLGFGMVVITSDVSLVNVMLVKTIVIIYFPFVNLLLWAMPHILMLTLWSSCGERFVCGGLLGETHYDRDMPNC